MLYRDIEIEGDTDDNEISRQEEPGDLLEEEETFVIRRDHQVPNVEVSDVLNTDGPPVHELNRVQGATISLFTSTTAEQMAFPTRWEKTSRDPPVSTLNYFQSRLLSEDNRWASHIPYLFWGLNVYEQRRLSENISVAVRLRSEGSNARGSRQHRREPVDGSSG